MAGLAWPMRLLTATTTSRPAAMSALTCEWREEWNITHGNFRERTTLPQSRDGVSGGYG